MKAVAISEHAKNLSLIKIDSSMWLKRPVYSDCPANEHNLNFQEGLKAFGKKRCKIPTALVERTLEFSVSDGAMAASENVTESWSRLC